MAGAGEPRTIRVLLIEDNPGDARLVKLALQEAEAAGPAAERFSLSVHSTLAGGLASIQEAAPDAVLLDLTLPDSGGIETFSRVRREAPGVPIVVLSGLADDLLAADAVRQGAQDYLPKADLAAPVLVRSLRYAIQRHHAEADRERLIREQAARAEAESQARENERLFREAQRAVRIRDEFLSVAAHELKTPLTSLRGTAQLALRRFDREGVLDTERLRTALMTIEQQSVKLARLVSQLLDTSRIEGGRLVIESEWTDLSAIARDVASFATLQTSRHQITVEANPPEQAVYASVDPIRFEQVVTNLVDNAVKFSPDGGPVEVTLWQQDEDHVALAVRDYGVGIPPKERRGIFQRFFQAHPRSPLTGTTTMAGLGLGLYISRHIVELHGGTLAAEFPRGGGSRFVVTLPVSGPPEGSESRGDDSAAT